MFSISGSLVSLLEGASGVILAAAVPPEVVDSFVMNSGAIFGVSRTVEGSDPGDEWIPGATLGFQVLIKIWTPIALFDSLVVGRVVTVGTPWIAVDGLVALVVMTDEFGGYMDVEIIV